MIPHVNHPNFGWALTAAELARVQGERFIEVYNGHPSVHNEGDSLRPSVERIWDLVNKARLSEGRPVLFGISVDDSHNYQEMAVGRVNPGRGWIMVRAADLSAASIIEAMESGDFYASTGVYLDEVSFDGETLGVDIAEEEGIDYTISFYGTMAGAANDDEAGILLDEQSGPEAHFTLTGSELYVRARIVSSKLKENPYREGELERAWTQPVRLPE
jgi:hypothetical protein